MAAVDGSGAVTSKSGRSEIDMTDAQQQRLLRMMQRAPVLAGEPDVPP